LAEYNPFKETLGSGREERHSPRPVPESPAIETATRRPPEGSINIGSYLDRPFQQPHNTRDLSLFSSRPSSSVHSGACSLLHHRQQHQPLLLSASGLILLAVALLLLLLLFNPTWTTYLQSAASAGAMTMTRQNTQHAHLKELRLLRSCHPPTNITSSSSYSSSSSSFSPTFTSYSSSSSS